MCVLLAASFTLPLFAHARSNLKTVRVGWYESPFNMMDRFGRRSGYAYEYQEKIAAYSGWEYVYVDGSWPELMQMLIDGEIDIMSDISYTEERADLILYPYVPMGSEEYYIFISANNSDYTPGDYSWFNGKKVGVNKGSVQTGFFLEWEKKNHVQAELTEVTGMEAESFRMLEEGKLDAFITLDAYGGSDAAVPVAKIGSSDYYFGINKNRPDLLDELNAALSRIQDENPFYNQQMYEKYISTSGANIFISAEEKAWLSGHGTVRVGYQDNYLAYCAADRKTGELTGALKDYLFDASVCFANAELDFEPIAYPSAAAAIEALRSGEVDCMFPSILSTSDGEELDIVMTPSMMTTEVYAIVRKADQHTFFQKDRITAAVEAGDPNSVVLVKDHFPDWQWKDYPDIQACLKAVYKGEADCVLIGNYQYNNLSRQCNKLKLTPLSTGKNVDYYIAVNRGSTELYSILTRTTGIVSKSKINAALSYYSSEDAKNTLVDFIRDNTAVDIAVLAVVAALLIVILAQRRVIRAKKEVKKSHDQVENLNKQVVVDALTHVRNKAGYKQWEEAVNEAIKNGEQEPFAVVVCDINDLKSVNDQFGHKEGDNCIQSCSSKICNTFSRSPVFRVGGDEFIVFLSGEDYYRRNELLAQINAIPKDRAKIRAGETLSAGMAEYDKEKHRSIQSVAEDADRAMYARKQYLKETVLKKDEDTDTEAGLNYIPVIHSRKHILIVDDMELNREIIGDLLTEDYDVSYASDGVEAMEALRSHKDDIDLVLLDLQMPNMDGREVIAQMQIDEDLMSIPVVILTVDQAAELDCLRIGAMDFIPKPYPDIEIVKARIAKCIELAEDRELIRYTERDKLTGLLNKDYFFRYVSRLDNLYRETMLDAVVCDVNKFHAINKQYGRQFGDRVLRSMGTALRKLAREIGGISCREEDDTFLLYCPHQENYEQLIDGFLPDVFAGKDIAEKVDIRFGVFTDARQADSIEERFSRAKIAADRVKNDPDKVCAYYELN